MFVVSWVLRIFFDSQILQNTIENLFIVLFFLGGCLRNIKRLPNFLWTTRRHNIAGIIEFFIVLVIGFIMNLPSDIIKFLSLSLDFFKDHFIIFLDFPMKNFPIL